MTDHPIIPPPELVQQWCDPRVTKSMHFFEEDLAARAAQWGADQELEACCEWLDAGGVYTCDLRAARRRKPPSLKEQALTALHAIATGANDTREQHQDLDTIRKALEQLNDE